MQHLIDILSNTLCGFAYPFKIFDLSRFLLIEELLFYKLISLKYKSNYDADYYFKVA